LFGRQELDGVEASSAKGALRRIRSATPTLDDDEVERLAHDIDRELRPVVSR
jgi:hypothetical protein